MSELKPNSQPPASPHNYSDEEGKSDRLAEWYIYPAVSQKAEHHKTAFKFGKERNPEVKCKCCGYYKVEENYSVFCGSPWEKGQNENSNASKKEGWITQCRMPSGVLVYLTFIKGVLLFLAFRFFIFDIWTAIISNDGSFCSELFRTKGKDLCLYTISGYNLKSTANKIGLHALDYFNAALTAFSLVYFVCFKKYLETKRSVIEMEDIEEDHYAIMVDNIPKSFLGKKEGNQKIKMINSKEEYLSKIENTFTQKILKWGHTGGSYLQQQYEFLKIFIPMQSLPDDCKREMKKYLQNGQNEYSQQSLLKKLKMKIITQITLCQDISQIDTLYDIRSSLNQQIQNKKSPEQYEQEQKKMRREYQEKQTVLQLLSRYNEAELFIQKKYAESNEVAFHLTHFTGKAIISFQYKYFRDYFLNEYEKDPDFLQIDGHSLSLSLPGKPTDIYWNNMKVPNQQRAKYHIYTWVVLVTMLILAFGLILVLELWKKGEEVVLENQSTWDKMERFAVTALSGLITALINYFLSEVIQIMAKSEKHITKSNEVSSLIVKSTVAQTLNTLFIYLFIYFMKPSNPLGPYGLVSKVVGAAIVTAAITPVLEIIQPAKLLKSFQNLALTKKSEDGPQKFQIELNREMQYTAFNKDNMYVYYILLTFWVSFYGFLSPLVPLLIIGLFAFQYWVDKCKIFYWSSPLVFKDDMVENIMTLLQFSVVLSSASYFAWDMSINYSEGLHLKPLNLICVVIALFYTGFEFFVKKSVKDRLLSNKTEDLKSYYKEKSYEEVILFNQNHMTYVNQNPATKHLKIHQKNIKNIKKSTSFSDLQIQTKETKDKQKWSKCCSQCMETLQNGKTTYCNHFYCQISQQNCPICICGWSNTNDHSCKRLESIITLKFTPFLSYQIKIAPKFIRFLLGCLQMILIPLATALLIALVVLFTAFMLSIATIIFPFFVLENAFRFIFLCDRGYDNRNLTMLFCFPCIFLKAIIFEIPGTVAEIGTFKSIIEIIKDLIMNVKHLFYAINPYKEKLSNYSRMTVESATRRKVYFSLMAVLLPVMFALAAAYYVASIAVVLAFTVVFCPYIVLKEKYVPFWIIIAFYPVILCTYLFSEYSSFVWNQTKELMTFYGNYIGTMCCYLFNQCSGENQLENRLQLPAEEPQN